VWEGAVVELAELWERADAGTDRAVLRYRKVGGLPLPATLWLRGEEPTVKAVGLFNAVPAAKAWKLDALRLFSDQATGQFPPGRVGASARGKRACRVLPRSGDEALAWPELRSAARHRDRLTAGRLGVRIVAVGSDDWRNAEPETLYERWEASVAAVCGPAGQLSVSRSRSPPACVVATTFEPAGGRMTVRASPDRDQDARQLFIRFGPGRRSYPSSAR
jgi:hypothetical protein